MAQHHIHPTDPSHRNHPQHDHSTHLASSEAKSTAHTAHDHAGMVADYRRRFWIALVLTVPILLLSPAGGHGLGLIGAIMFPGSHLVLLALSSAVYFYGGWPFLTGLVSELRQRQPGMMTLISLAISVAYFLLGGGGAGPERQRPVLGAGHAHRHHAAGALDRDEVGDGSVRCAQSTGRAAARHRTSAGCGWQTSRRSP